MRKNKSIIKRIFCLTFAMFLFASNFSFAFASFVYDSSIHTMMDFENSEYRNIIMAKLGEIEEFNLYGADLEDIETIELDRLSKKSFTAFNTSNFYTRMLLTVGEMEWDSSGDTYGYYRNIKIDGVEYNTTLVKEEITFTDLILKAKQSTTGKFIYTGEYLLEPFEAQFDYSTMMIVTIEGDVYDHYYVHVDSGEDYNLHFGLDLKADNNKATVDINGHIQELPYADEVHDFSKEDLGNITIRFIAPVLIAEFINEQNSATPAKVTAAAVASVAMATTSSVALSSVSGNSGDLLDLGEETDESFESYDEEESTDDKNKISHPIIINNNEALPILCNSKGSVVNIPMHIEDGENLNWSYVVIPYAPGGLGSFIPTVINPLGDNTTDLSVSFTGKKFEENSIQIICNIFATAKLDDEEHKAHGIVELTAYNLGLQAKIKNSNKNITKDNLTITYVKDSKFKGIAEIIKLKSKEFVIEFTEKTESQTIALITAVKSEYGSVVITTNKE